MFIFEQVSYGIFSTVGGSGSGSYGAGSAGRISINSTVVIQYEGDYLVFGGAGASDELAAGGGTVYLPFTEISPSLMTDKPALR
jgi:hypothetical protein